MSQEAEQGEAKEETKTAHPPVTVLLRRGTKALLVGEISQHGPVGLVILLAGLDQIREGARGWMLLLALASLAAGGALLVAMATEVRALRSKKPHHGHFPWVNLLSAPVVALEGVHKHYEGLHYVPYCYFAIAVALLLTTPLHSHLPKLRRIRMDSGGLEFKRSPLTRRYWRWKDLKSVEPAPKGLRLVFHSSPPYLLVLARFENAQEIRDAVLRGFETWKPVPEQPGSREGTEPASRGAGEPGLGGPAFEEKHSPRLTTLD